MKKTQWFDFDFATQPSAWRIIAAALLGMMLLPFTGLAFDKGHAEHVVIVVWDGMRPDFVTPQFTPTLWQLAAEGTFFNRHHPVYISTTEVNGTALITGQCPSHSTIVGNTEYRPGINPHAPVDTQDLETVRANDQLTSGHHIATPTLTELVQASGDRTAIAGTKSVALLLDRQVVRTAAMSNSITFFSGDVLPASAMELLVSANGGENFPARVTFPNLAQDAWTTKALTQGMWSNGVPKFSVLWMSDPDYTQHKFAPGSPQALGALASIDNNLAVLLAALKEKGVREKTDVFVVSDHGFSTVGRNVEVAKELTAAGFNAARTFENPQPGDVVVVGLGGTVLLYVIGHDEAIIRRLGNYFQTTDYAGVIFSRVKMKGTFPLSAVHLDSPGAPDLAVSLKWSDARNEFGAPGELTYDGGKKLGGHGSLSPFDMHNTLVAAGPDLRAGFTNDLPSGNLDLAPTIAWILGLKPTRKMDGRMLSEALVNPPFTAPKVKTKTLEAARDLAEVHWHQYLKQSSVGTTTYFDEGDGEAVKK
jgi:predicted AlkP superfamily pyrophosphatase or phosphodiesterase